MSAALNPPLSESLEPVHGLHASSRSSLQPIVLYGSFGLLLFGPLAFGAVDPWAIFLIEAGSALLFLIWIWQQIQQQELRLTPNPIFAPVLVFAGLVGIQYFSGLTSYRYATASAALIFCAQGLLCFLVTQTLQRTFQVNRLALIFSVYGVVLASFAILQSVSSAGKIYWFRSSHGWAYGPYVNHNHYAGIMELLIPVPMVLSLTHFVRDRKKGMAALAAAVMAASIFLSGSRGGMAALAVQIGIFSAMVVRRRAKLGNAALAIGIFVIAMIGAVVWVGGGQISARMSSIHSEARAELSGGTRVTIDRDSLRMFAEKPILGWGLATFPEVYPQFRSFYSDFVVNAAHNDYLQLLVETGALGFVTMLWFLIVTYRGAIRKVDKNWPSDTNGAVALAAILGITGMLVHSFVDFNLQVPANAAMFYVMCSIAAMSPQFGKSKRRSRKNDPFGELITH